MTATAVVVGTVLAQAFGIPGGLLGLAVLFLVLALVAYLLGAGGVAGFSMDIAKVLIVVFIILAVLAFLGNLLG